MRPHQLYLGVVKCGDDKMNDKVGDLDEGYHLSQVSLVWLAAMQSYSRYAAEPFLHACGSFWHQGLGCLMGSLDPAGFPGHLGDFPALSASDCSLIL